MELGWKDAASNGVSVAKRAERAKGKCQKKIQGTQRNIIAQGPWAGKGPYRESVPSGTPLALGEDVTQEGKHWQAKLFMLYLWHFLCPAYLDPGIEDIQKGQGVSQRAPQASPGCQAVQVIASPAPVQEGRGHAEDRGNGERRGSQVQERPQHQHLPCRGRECMRQQAVPTQAATPPCYERPH